MLGFSIGRPKNACIRRRYYLAIIIYKRAHCTIHLQFERKPDWLFLNQMGIFSCVFSFLFLPYFQIHFLCSKFVIYPGCRKRRNRRQQSRRRTAKRESYGRSSINSVITRWVHLGPLHWASPFYLLWSSGHWYASICVISSDSAFICLITVCISYIYVTVFFFFPFSMESFWVNFREN